MLYFYASSLYEYSGRILVCAGKHCTGARFAGECSICSKCCATARGWLVALLESFDGACASGILANCFVDILPDRSYEQGTHMYTIVQYIVTNT